MPMSPGKWLAVPARLGEESLKQMLHTCVDHSNQSADFKDTMKTSDYIRFHNSDCFTLF